MKALLIIVATLIVSFNSQASEEFTMEECMSKAKELQVDTGYYQYGRTTCRRAINDWKTEAETIELLKVAKKSREADEYNEVVNRQCNDILAAKQLYWINNKACSSTESAEQIIATLPIAKAKRDINLLKRNVIDWNLYNKCSVESARSFISGRKAKKCDKPTLIK